MVRQGIAQLGALSLLLVASTASVAVAQDESPSADEAAVIAVGKAYVDAFNRGDAKALADSWVDDAVYTNWVTGETLEGRAAIAAQFEKLFATEQRPKLKVTVDAIEFVSPNVAVEQGVAAFTQGEDVEQIRYTAVYVERQGKWLLDRVTDKESISDGGASEHLKDLDWLVGRWVDEDDRVRIVTECGWTKNRNFLTRSFTVSTGDDVELSGMQIIGWDPVANHVRSWTFDSDGGFSEGTWNRKGDGWHVHKGGTLSDGRRASAVNIIEPIDGSSFRLRSVQRSVGGELLPNMAPVRVVRE